MNPVIISCKTIEQELLSAMEQTGHTYPIFWLESGLHNWPEKLNARIQELLDGCNDYDTVLLAMSFCGNAVVGLRTHDFQLAIPRCDDCITLLLGSAQRRQNVSATYFLTEGWLKGERNIWTEYEYCVHKYGEKLGKRIFSSMLAHYRNLALLDTGCFDCEAIEQQVQKIAQTLNLEYIRIDGTLDYIRELLDGKWSKNRFVFVPPNSTVTTEMCTLKGAPYGI